MLAHAPEGGEGEGIYTVVFDPEEGKFQNVTSSNIKTNPAFIMKHPSLDIVYMTTEVISDERSEVLVGEINRKNGVVEIVDRYRTFYCVAISIHLGCQHQLNISISLPGKRCMAGQHVTYPGMRIGPI